MTWARAAYTTQLRHDFSPFPGSDHWAQVDVWIPNLDPCPSPTSPGVAFLPYFLKLAGWNGLGASSTCSPTPCWHWSTINSNFASPGPAAGATYTVGYHVRGGTVDWYVNGVLVLSEALSGVGSFNFLILNYSANACCCRGIYYTNVKVGTTQGGTDVFSDDFSAGLDNWYATPVSTLYPPVVSIVDTPTVTACPTLTVTPTRALPGEPITVTASNFTAGSPLTIYWSGINGAQPVEEVTEVADGSGNVTFTMTVPHGGGTTPGQFPTPQTIIAIDYEKLVGCTPFIVCGASKRDGIQADVAPDGFTNLNTPAPLVAYGGTSDNFQSQNFVLDYIWHDGAHWVLWIDPSQTSGNNSTFPPPANHTLNATRISADGASVVDYPLDTNYAWAFGSGNDDDPGLFESWPDCGQPSPIWSRVSYFSSWQKPVYDAHFASDGDTLWVGLVTAESVPYQWIDNKDAHSINPGGAAQATPLGALTAGFTSFATDTSTGYLRYYTNPTGPLDFFKDSAFPLTDAGIKGMGVWNPPVVVMFAFNGSSFNRIGEVAAKYCPSVIGQTDGYENQGGSLIGGTGAQNPAPNGALFGRVALAASANDPGVCHVVWSEGGDWGRVSDGAACTTGPFGGSRFTWDAGPANRSYRVNYTTWSPTAKLTDTDLSSSHIDRTNWWFPYSYGGFFNNVPNGYTWPIPGEFAALLNYELRCDNANGDVLLFLSNTTPFQGINPPNGNPDPDGHPWLDNFLLFGDTIHVYELTGGTAVLKQSITPDLFPNEIEGDTAYPSSPGSNQPDASQPPKASDCCFIGPSPFPFGTSYGPQVKGFGISRIYEDPKLDGQPVYLLHVPWARRFGDSLHAGYGNYPMRGFYRVPADMSAPFDFLDGERQLQYTIVGGAFVSQAQFDSSDFWVDEKNIWVPTPSTGGRVQSPSLSLWFDKVCKNRWTTMTAAETPGNLSNSGFTIGAANCPGFHYDPDSDSVAYVAPTKSPQFPKLFAVQQLFFCRGCDSCTCGPSIHIAHRF